MAKKFYITTTIPYANAPPHIGFALEIVQADVLARWHRLLGEEVFFLTGTDEHGSKNYKMAKEANLSPKEFVTKNSKFFLDLTKTLDISNNYFIRTTDKKIHWPGVIEIWKRLEKNGDLYKKKYSGNYCYGCERFVTEKDLIDKKCPDHPNLDIEEISEENYFFRLSKYSDKIKKIIKSNEYQMLPEKWKNDFLSLIKDGLTDVSFSREKKHLPWGIPVPGDENQIMYIWPDALTNYLTGIGFPDKKYKKFWPADIHIVGKDMPRFHAGIWPGMLLSAKIPLPKKLIIHGFLTSEGKKMSKSLGNVVAPLELVKNYPSDSIRYVLMRSTPFGEDGDFSESSLIERHNSELANKLGNLVSRVSALAEKQGIKKTPNKLIKKLNLKKIENHFDSYELDKALNEIFSFIDLCNLYIQDKKPWEDSCKNKEQILYELSDSIKVIAILLYPFIPQTSEKIAKIFNFKISFKEIKNPLKISKIKKSQVLFEKIIIKKEETKNEKTNKDQNPKLINQIKQPKETIPGIMSVIEFKDWEKIELRVGKIEKVEDIKDADKLYKLTINLGEKLGIRTVCAGLKEYYSKETLEDKQIILFVNLAPRIMRGIESQGMILAAVSEDHKDVILISPEKSAKLGSKVS